MNLTERQTRILEWAKNEEHVEVDDIAAQFNVTPQTVRKDINRLCELGVLRRRYGGVSLPSSVSNLSVGTRQVLNPLSKRAIAAELTRHIPENSSVYLGVGSTIEFAARALSAYQSLKVLTNNLGAVSAFSANPGIEVLVAGGSLRHNDIDVVGHETVRFFNDFHVDFGVIGSGGLDPVNGLLDFDVREAQISQAILANARHRILIADHSKWERKAPVKVAPFSDVDLFITDSVPAAEKSALPGSLRLIETDRQSGPVTAAG